jgi:hypothetical protein
LSTLGKVYRRTLSFGNRVTLVSVLALKISYSNKVDQMKVGNQGTFENIQLSTTGRKERQCTMSLTLPQVLAFITFLFSAAIWLTSRVGRRNQTLPPGPPGIPILGNLTEFPKKWPHYQFAKWGTRFSNQNDLQFILTMSFRCRIWSNHLTSDHSPNDYRAQFSGSRQGCH